jgi:NitT/TauT family transport system substrate-binding protein
MRRSVVLAALFAASLPEIAWAQSASQPLRVASTTDEDVMGVVYAHESGAFAKAGLDVVLIKGNSGASIAAGVAGGAIDIGKSSIMGLINAHARGIPFSVIAPCALFTTEIPNAGLVVAKDGPIHSARDLNGRRLSVAALHDLFSIAMEAWIDQHGGDSSSVKFVELPNSAAAEALASGRVDAATMANPHLRQALVAGKVRELGQSFSAIAPNFLVAGFFTTTDLLDRRREEIARFRHVLAEASAFVNAHPEATTNLEASYTGVEPTIIASLPRTRLATSLDPRLIQPVIDRAAQYHAIPHVFDARTMIDPSALGVS